VNVVVARLAQVKAAQITALEIMAQISASGLPPDAESLLAMAPELEAAIAQADELAKRSKRAIKRCLCLKAIPLNQTPPGF